MKSKKVLIILFTVFLLGIFLSGAIDSVQAGNLANEHIVPESGKETGDYTANDLILVLVTISKWVLYLSGSLSLLAFIVGGLMFILAAGNKDMISKGKSAIIAAVVGLIIVLFAYTAVDYFMKGIKGTENSNSNWNVTP
ncbi:hypothetical protein C0583_05900 [Candidatus Parcubacteria bacterium]|nr:MAG: hypothetical protein C0583_05900 [Candidatus Parcubacteria bacterium]